MVVIPLPHKSGLLGKVHCMRTIWTMVQKNQMALFDKETDIKDVVVLSGLLVLLGT